MSDEYLNLIKTQIEPLPFCSKGRRLYRDRDLPGFTLRVGRRNKIFYAVKWNGDRVEWIKIGDAAHISPMLARQRAKEILGRIVLGETEVLAKKARAKTDVTLRQALERYIANRRNTRPLSPRTARDYQDRFERYLSDWLDKPLREIRPSMVVARHSSIAREVRGRNSNRNGQCSANDTFRIFRATYNYARADFVDEETEEPLLPENPANKLRTTKAWFQAVRRKTYIQFKDMPKWFDALSLLDNSMIGDYLELLLFTGLRRSEGAQLIWDNIDFENETFTVPKTKNGKPHTLPMTPPIWAIFERRATQKVCDWVFHNRSGNGPLTEPRKQIALMIHHGCPAFAPHDLRRTFATVAESLDISSFTLKRLLNHSLDNQDVTAGYIMLETDRLRDPMRRISDAIVAYGRGMSPPSSLHHLAREVETSKHKGSAIPTLKLVYSAK